MAVVSDAVVKAGPWQAIVERTVTGLGYELVDIERAARGLLRITIDRIEGRVYPSGESEFILVEDCELVTRQLQHVLEVEACDYQRLEVSSPGLDRPLKHSGDYTRFAGQAVDLTLKAPLDGRRKFRGQLLAGVGEGAGPEDWRLVFDDGKGEQALDFTLSDVREARLVPVVDFKGRRARPAQAPDADGGGNE